jgi:ABC-type lipoprotein release transport system permease subunit
MVRWAFLRQTGILRAGWDPDLQRPTLLHQVQRCLSDYYFFSALTMFCIYLAVVAASAMKGFIAGVDSTQILSATPEFSVTVPSSSSSSSKTATAVASTAERVEGFPEVHTGSMIFCDADNLDTDGIYPGMYTYQDDLTPAQMAEVAMKNYDPAFSSTVAKVKKNNEKRRC